MIPELPPRLLTAVIRVLSRQTLVDAIFNWYLGLLPPALARDAPRAPARPEQAVVAVGKP